MDVSIFLAKLLGVYLIVVSIGMFVNFKAIKNAAVSMAQNSALILFGGAMTLIMGTMAVLFHNVWVGDWRIVVTIFCWLVLIKGVLLFVFPGSIKFWIKMIDKNNSIMMVSSVVMLIVGLYLGYMGFLA
ncbi:MAG: hypothetical protein ABIH21_02230 [Patescibacteria group bacterium]